jgi:Fur family ferric uptake transcriptional regulator
LKQYFNKSRNMKHVIQTLRDKGYRMTQPRRTILAVLAESDALLRPGEVLARARRHNPSLGAVTVYRTLNLLVELGFVRCIHLEDGCARYARKSRGHNHHLICIGCQAAIEFPECGLSALMNRLAKETGFQIQGHILELVGLCPNCQH